MRNFLTFLFFGWYGLAQAQYSISTAQLNALTGHTYEYDVYHEVSLNSGTLGYFSHFPISQIRNGSNVRLDTISMLSSTETYYLGPHQAASLNDTVPWFIISPVQNGVADTRPEMSVMIRAGRTITNYGNSLTNQNLEHSFSNFLTFWKPRANWIPQPGSSPMASSTGSYNYTVSTGSPVILSVQHDFRYIRLTPDTTLYKVLLSRISGNDSCYLQKFTITDERVNGVSTYRTVPPAYIVNYQLSYVRYMFFKKGQIMPLAVIDLGNYHAEFWNSTIVLYRSAFCRVYLLNNRTTYPNPPVILTGIAEANQVTSAIELFPNPASDEIQVSGLPGGDISILDRLGKVVYSGSIESDNAKIYIKDTR